LQSNLLCILNKKILIPILAIIVVAVFVIFTHKSNEHKIGLVYIADAEAIDLAKHSIVNSFKQKKYEAILALTTPCAQIAQQQIKEQPIIFVGVSGPIGAGLVKELYRGFENVTET